MRRSSPGDGWDWSQETGVSRCLITGGAWQLRPGSPSACREKAILPRGLCVLQRRGRYTHPLPPPHLHSPSPQGGTGFGWTSAGYAHRYEHWWSSPRDHWPSPSLTSGALSTPSSSRHTCPSYATQPPSGRAGCVHLLFSTAQTTLCSTVLDNPQQRSKVATVEQLTQYLATDTLWYCTHTLTPSHPHTLPFSAVFVPQNLMSWCPCK